MRPSSKTPATDSLKLPTNKSHEKKQKVILIIVAIFAVLLFVIAMMYLRIYMTFISQFKWFKFYQGKQTSKIDFWHIYSAYDSNFMFHLTNFNKPLAHRLTLIQIEFFVTELMKFAYNEDEHNNPRGGMLPCHLTNSALYKPGQGIRPFTTWYNTQTPPPVYPTKDDKAGWMKRIAKWCGKTDSFWSKIKESGLYEPQFIGEAVTNWYNLEENPDNFLACNGIPPDSALVIGYINGSANSWNGYKLNPALFETLIFEGNSLEWGGWVGMLKKLDGFTSTSDFNRIMYHANSPTHAPPGNSTCSASKGSAWTTAILSSISSGLGIAALGFMAGPEVGVPLLVSSVVGAAVMGGQIVNQVIKTKECEN